METYTPFGKPLTKPAMHPYQPLDNSEKEKKGINDPKGCLKNILLAAVIVTVLGTLAYVLEHYFGISP